MYSLGFKDKPDYDKIRKMFKQKIEDLKTRIPNRESPWHSFSDVGKEPTTGETNKH